MSTMNFRSSRQRGFTLVELMVGVVIGMLSILVITQVMTLAEGKKRTVSMGSDAQVNGALALFTIQRDIEQAGYGAVVSPDALGCVVNYKFGSASASSFTLAPVVIGDGGAANASDTLTILQANTTGFSTPMLLTGASAQSDDHFTVASTLGAATDGLMIAVPVTQDATHACTLFSVEGASTNVLSNTNLPHASTSGYGQWNAGLGTIMPTGGYPNKSYVLNMGAMISRLYAVSSAGNLTTSDLGLTTGTRPATPPDAYPQIVMMQALYGKDTDGDGVVDTYNKTAPANNAAWQKVLSIRVALVSRSNQYEKDVVTTAAPGWDVGTNTTVAGTTSTCNGSSKCLQLDVSGLTDWQHYRYKVYDTIIPLRNVLWNN